MGLMLPHRTTIYTIRCNFPSTRHNHFFPVVFRATILCKTIRDLCHDMAINSVSPQEARSEKRGRDGEKLENQTYSFRRENS